MDSNVVKFSSPNDNTYHNKHCTQSLSVKYRCFNKAVKSYFKNTILCTDHNELNTVKSVLSGHSKTHQKLVINTDYRLMQVKRIAECSKGSILQHFRPPLSYHFSLRPLFCLFLVGRFRLVLLYWKTWDG